MKQVRIDTLLEPPQDGAVYQREWTTKGQCREKGLLLELAFFAGMIGPNSTHLDPPTRVPRCIREGGTGLGA